MGSLRITRTRQYANFLRRFELFVDGRSVGYLGHGETIRLDLESGRHDVYVQIDWCRSRTVTIVTPPAAEPALVAGCYATGWQLLLVLIYVLVPGWYVYLRQVHPDRTFDRGG